MTHRPIRALLIDEGAEDHQRLRELLATLPGPITLAWLSQGDLALEDLARNGHDVYLLDQRLGQWTGLELLREARRVGCQRPMILLTGTSEPALEQAALEAGASDTLPKDRLDGWLLERALRHAQALQRRGAELERCVEERTAELRRANASLREREEIIRGMIESVKDHALFPLDPEGRVASWNGGAERLFGQTEAEILGRSAALLYVPGEVADGVRSPDLLRAVREGRAEAERWYVRKDGSRFLGGEILTPRRDGAGRLVGFTLVIRDLSERHRTERQLGEAIDYLEKIVETVHDPLVVLGPDLDVRAANRSFYRTFQTSPAETLRRRLYDLGDRQWDIPRLRVLLEEILPRDGAFQDFEMEHTFPNVGPRSVRLNGRRFHREEDRSLVLLAFEDVTGARRAEQALAVSRERFDLVVQATELGVWYCDLPLNNLIWNDKCKEHFGLPPEAEVTYALFLERLHPEDRERTQQAIERAVAERVPYDVEYRTVAPGSLAKPGQARVRWIRAMGRAFYRNGVAVRFDGVTVDVTEQKRAAEETAGLLVAEQRRAERLRRLAEAALKLTAATSRAAVLDAVTEQARLLIPCLHALCSLTIDDGCEQSLHSLSRAEACLARAENVSINREVCERNQPLRLKAAELLTHPVGRTLSSLVDSRPLRGLLAVPLQGRDGRNLGVVQLADREEGDFTEEDEAILTQLALLASVALENVRLVEALRETDRRKDEFLALLAHELRNPLATISNTLAQARLRLRAQVGGGDPLPPPEMERMNRQAEHLMRAANDLLDVSLITRGKINLRRQPCDLAGVLHRAVEGAQPLIEERGHSLAVMLADDPLPVEADVVRLTQVVQNLLSNAARYTEPGGKIQLRAELESGWAVVRIRDTGKGIPREHLSAIFEPFFQVDRMLDRVGGGLGIGLTLVRRLTELHGGTVEASSEGAGRGSEFILRLPLNAATVATVLPETSLPEPGKSESILSAGLGSWDPSRLLDPWPQLGPGAEPARQAELEQTHRILVVDDNCDAAESLAILLRLMGHEVRIAFDGPEGLAAAEEYRPDLILLDIGMPGMSGLEVARRLRAMPAGAAVTLIALTGFGTREDRQRSRAAGFNAHLVKPLDLDALHAVLASPELEKGGWVGVEAG